MTDVIHNIKNKQVSFNLARKYSNQRGALASYANTRVLYYLGKLDKIVIGYIRDENRPLVRYCWGSVGVDIVDVSYTPGTDLNKREYYTLFTIKPSNQWLDKKYNTIEYYDYDMDTELEFLLSHEELPSRANNPLLWSKFMKKNIIMLTQITTTEQEENEELPF